MRFTLSDSGGDRATGYTMNNKIVSLPEGYLSTWLDSVRQNQWALVDKESGEVLRQGRIGAPGLDNHCGAALEITDDLVHALIGGHHGPLEHHTMKIGEWLWSQVGVAGQQATYPSVTVDLAGVLHVFYRHGSKDHWTLNTSHYENGTWTDPAELVQAHKPGYIYWTNGATTGPDGTIHLTFGNARALADGSIHYGASHIQSRSRGAWLTSTGNPLSGRPLAAESIPCIGDADAGDRAQSSAEILRYEAPGPENYNYQQMNLSNPVTDAEGSVHVVLHNNKAGTAGLWTLSNGQWSVRNLTADALGHSTGRIHPQSSLSIDASGVLHAVLMVEPTDHCVWGPAGTTVAWVRIDGDNVNGQMLCDRDPESAQWLPALEHPCVDGLDHIPALLYTRGQNAGGFGDNQNELKTKVYLVTEGVSNPDGAGK
jgi:hypothetical protein